jgi:hypothetical protein
VKAVPEHRARDLLPGPEPVHRAEAIVAVEPAGGVVEVPHAQPGRLQREAALLLAAPQCRLGPLAPGHVPQHGLHRGPAVEQHRGGGRLGDDGRAVEPTQRQLDQLVAGARLGQPRGAGPRQRQARLVDQGEGAATH